MKTKTKGMLGSLFLCMVLLLSGCGTGAVTDDELLADMKEFALSDESASLYLNKEWESEDTGEDQLLIVANDNGTEGVLMFQIPKGEGYQISSIDDMETLVDESFQTSEKEDAEVFEIPGMSNVSATRCKFTSGSISGEAFVVCGETDYAFYAITYVGNKWNERMTQSFRVSCSKFAESESVIEGMDTTTAELTDTIRWFNASYAVLTEINGWDYNRFGGIAANETTQQLEIESLEEWWDVTDRASADETLDWTLTEGHRTEFAENMAYLEEMGMGEAADRKSFILENFEMTPDEADAYVNWYGMYEQYGADAIAGWDYCRALNLVSFYYLAGYYSENEALDKSLEIAQTVQPLFGSWDDLVASYMRGYEYWAGESSAERQAVYEDIKSRDDSPYQVDFKMQLEKTW